MKTEHVNDSVYNAHLGLVGLPGAGAWQDVPGVSAWKDVPGVGPWWDVPGVGAWKDVRGAGASKDVPGAGVWKDVPGALRRWKKVPEVQRCQDVPGVRSVAHIKILPDRDPSSTPYCRVARSGSSGVRALSMGVQRGTAAMRDHRPMRDHEGP